MIDVAKLRGLLAAAVLDARRLPLTVVLEDGANPDGGYSWNLGDCRGAFVCGSMSRTEAEAIAAAVNAMPALLDELEALRDCGQEGVCRVPPGCARHWEERNRELVAECDALRADADDQFRLGREAGIETSRGPLADFQRRAEKAEAQLEFLEDGRTYAADFHRRAEKAKDEALRAALASIASAYRIPACWPANLSRLVSVAVCAQQVRDEAQQTRDAAVTEVLAWRRATGCDTAEEAERMRSAVTSGLAELARMDRVPCRHYRECNCREVLDREQVMTEIMAIKRALVGKL